MPDFLPDSYPDGWQVFAQVIGHDIDPVYESWLADRRQFFRQNLPLDRPSGLIHADLFDDNVLFVGKKFVSTQVVIQRERKRFVNGNQMRK